MSNQNDGDLERRQQNDPQIQHELPAALPIALQNQTLSPIFKLNILCWDEVFDRLSLTDVHAFGQTCKIFHQIAGKYFQWKYQRVFGIVFSHSMTIELKDLNGFNKFVQRVSCQDEEEPHLALKYAAENCKSVRQMEIKNVYECPGSINIEHIKDMLSKLEVLKICNVEYSNEYFESLVSFCVNLKRLKIMDSPGSGWMNRGYSQLQHLEKHYCDECEDNDLIAFFKQNPNVCSFTTTAKMLLRNQDAFSAHNIQFDNLAIIVHDDVERVFIALNELYQRGFYKRLHYAACSVDRLDHLPGLYTLCVDTFNSIKIPFVTTITELSFKALWNRQCAIMDIDQVSKALINIKRIHCLEIRTEYIMPFIRNSVKLKEIKMKNTCDDCACIDPVLMNDEREKLQGARKVVVYIDEMDYLKIRWKFNRMDFGLIEVRRNASYDGLFERIFNLF